MTDEHLLSWICDADLDWHEEHPNGGFMALRNGFLILINDTVLTISKGLKKISVQKPTRPIWKEKTVLDNLFEEVVSQAAKQCLSRYVDGYEENLRNELLKELMGLR